MDTILNFALGGLAVASLLCLYRVIVGPTVPDRALGLDTLAMNILGIIVLISIKGSTEIFFDAVLTLAILSFVGTTALSKFIVKGVIIDRDPN